MYIWIHYVLHFWRNKPSSPYTTFSGSPCTSKIIDGKITAIESPLLLCQAMLRSFTAILVWSGWSQGHHRIIKSTFMYICDYFQFFTRQIIENSNDPMALEVVLSIPPVPCAMYWFYEVVTLLPLSSKLVSWDIIRGHFRITKHLFL